MFIQRGGDLRCQMTAPKKPHTHTVPSPSDTRQNETNQSACEYLCCHQSGRNCGNVGAATRVATGRIHGHSKQNQAVFNHDSDSNLQFDPSKLGSTWFRISSEFLLTECQFISMFSTVAGGFELSKILGQPVGPGKANWMAAAYSYVHSPTTLLTGTDPSPSALRKVPLFSSAVA